MNKNYELPKYDILTKASAMNVDLEEVGADFVREQDNILKTSEIYNNDGTRYLVHFFNSAWFDEQIRDVTISDAIQMLAIKEGYDLVQFENGNFGYIAYYGGEENGFEILSYEVLAHIDCEDDEAMYDAILEKAVDVISISKHDERTIHVFESAYSDDVTYIDCLANVVEPIACNEGCDIVKFTNGHFGVIGTNDGERNGFEII